MASSSARITSFSTRSGQPKRCAATSRTWISANDPAMSTADHCTSLRCFSRSQNPSTRAPMIGFTNDAANLAP
jgi:hypothetical protein